MYNRTNLPFKNIRHLINYTDYICHVLMAHSLPPKHKDAYTKCVSRILNNILYILGGNVCRCCDTFFLYIFVFILLKNPISLSIFIVYSISFIIIRIYQKKCPSKVESNVNDLPSFDGFILIVFLCTYCLPDILFRLLIPYKAC